MCSVRRSILWTCTYYLMDALLQVCQRNGVRCAAALAVCLLLVVVLAVALVRVRSAPPAALPDKEVRELVDQINGSG